MSTDNSQPLGSRVVALARESLVYQQEMGYTLADEWATDFLDPLLKAADALVLNDGRIFTKNGKVARTCNVPWAIHSTLTEFANRVIVISDWRLATLQREVIKRFEQHLYPETQWLELLNGTAYYRCYPLPYSQVVVPVLPRLTSKLALDAVSALASLPTSEANRQVLEAMGHSRERQKEYLRFMVSLILVNGGGDS